jgi:hypothetical protein
VASVVVLRERTRACVYACVGVLGILCSVLCVCGRTSSRAGYVRDAMGPESTGQPPTLPCAGWRVSYTLERGGDHRTGHSVSGNMRHTHNHSHAHWHAHTHTHTQILPHSLAHTHTQTHAHRRINVGCAVPYPNLGPASTSSPLNQALDKSLALKVGL